MKVLYLRTDFYGAQTDGGSFTMQKGIVSGLRECGADVAVVTSCPAPFHGDVPIYAIPYSRMMMNLPEVFSIAHNRRVVRKIRSILTQFKPDVIYQRHSSHNITGAMVRRRYRVPYILQFDGSEVWMKRHWSKTYFPAMLARAETIALRCASLVTVVSEPMRRMAIDAGAAAERVIIVPNGVDVERFSPNVPWHPIRTQRQWEETVIVGFVGTFDQWHGADVLAHAFAIVSARVPHVRAIFVGDGAMFGHVVEIIERVGLADRVAFVGRVPHAEVPAYLSACDILAVPTIPNPDGTEFFGSPTKLFEYMAMGKAIVASPLGQVRDIISDGENGIWCEPGNPTSLAESIIALACDAPLRQKLGQKARADAVKYHSWSARARVLLDAWEAISNIH
jgi:glycosyltransferase involved in cell wall biosynthesis